MRSSRLIIVLVASGAILALGLAAFTWTLRANTSEAQQGAMQSCPRHGRMKNRYEGNRQRLSSCRTVVQDRSILVRKA